MVEGHKLNILEEGKCVWRGHKLNVVEELGEVCVEGA